MAENLRKCLYCSADISGKHPTALFCSRSHGSAYRVKGRRHRSAAKAPNWTPEEIEGMRRDPHAPVPGRTPIAIMRKQRDLKIKRANSRLCSEWTDDEIAAITADKHFVPPGRSRNAVLKHLHGLGLHVNGRLVPWTDDEIAQITANPLTILPNRSQKSIANKLIRLGLGYPKRRGAHRAKTVPAITGPLAGSVLAAASPKTPGFEVFLELNRLCLRSSERDDIVSEAAILMIEGGLSAREAISKATRTVRSFDSSKFRHIEYRDELYHPAGDAM